MIRRLTSVPAADVLHHDEGALVLMGERLIALSLVGSAAYELATDGIKGNELAAALAELFGVPADADLVQLTSDVIDLLVAQGLLSVDEASR